MRKIVKKSFAYVLAAAVVSGSVPTAAMDAAAAGLKKENRQIAAKTGETTSIVNLKTEGKENPLGVDTASPVFSWQMLSDATGINQISYQLVVQKADDNAVVWDSGEVKSGDSAAVTYGGSSLEASTGYNWSVVVKDNFGNETVSDPAYFETSLMSTDLSAWDGAEWIGADELSLDAAGSTLFDISTKVRIPKGSTGASVIFGADDFRLKNKLFNIDMMEGENYFRVELDISQVDESGGAAINIYRVGYFDGDTPEQPFMVINKVNNQVTNLDELITNENKNETHTLELNVVTSTLTMFIDGQEIAVSEAANGSGTSGGIVLSDQGSSDAMTFPNLNSIGFAARAGQKAIFTDYELKNPGFGTGILFGEKTGASYSIWNDKEGITIEGSKITVEGTEGDIMAYGDPSYASEPYLRTDFTLDNQVASARLYMGIQGIGDFYINGEEVAPDEWFKQGSMEYREEIGYNVYDVTDYLAQGENAMGAVLGEGWWTGHACTFSDGTYNYYGDQEALLIKLVVNYADGTSETIVTDDDTWEYYGDGPVRFASLFEGERYDATKEDEIDGFTKADYNAEAAGWRQAEAIETRKPFADQKLIVRHDDEVHVINTLEASLMGENKKGSGSYIYDFGENVAAVPQITIPSELAEEGETITIRVAEMLYPELDEYGDLAGNLLQENYRAALTTDFYTMKAGEQTYVPDLTFHGYRYIEITGLKQALPAEYVKSLVLSSIDNTATFDSSNELVNRLFKNGQNSEASNYITLPTDCPQRNERMGWMGDANVYALAGSYNANTYQFLRQWMNCVRQTQGADGMTGHVSPNYPSFNMETGEVKVGGMSFGITWNSAIVFIPFFLYQQYGDTAIVQENMDAIYAYMKNLEGKPLSYEKDGEKHAEPALTSQTGFLCDHLSVVDTDGAMLGNAMYVYCLRSVAAMAKALGQKENADKYTAMYDAAKEAWNRIYIDAESGKSCSANGSIIHTQASYASPINYGVVDEKKIDKYLENYIDSIEHPTANDGTPLTPYTITTGFNATPNVLNALSDHGRSDVAYKMLECTDYASWLYPVTQGATSIWERWNSYTEENGFGGNNGMNSFNHYSLGAVTSWMMDSQLGIKYDETSPGYKHFILQPVAGGTFTYANGSFESAYGTIYSGWTAAQEEMTAYEAVVPANTTATLYLAMNKNQADCLELPQGASLIALEQHNGTRCAKIELLSGSYSIDIPDKEEAAEIISQKAREKAEAAEKEAEAARKEAAEANKKAGEAWKAAEAAKKEAGENSAKAKAALEAAQKAQQIAVDAQNRVDRFEFKNKKMSIKTLKSSKKKYAKVTWKKVSGAEGYVIQYSGKSNFSGKKIMTIKKGTTLSKTVKKLKSGKKYYFRVRAYKTIGGKKVYTGYSNKKSIKIR